MRLVLFQPEIPQNTGNIIRTCKLTGSSLLLIRPLGFSLSSRYLKRAGLDYFDGVSVEVIDDLIAYLEDLKDPFYFFSSKAKKNYSSIRYSEKSHLIFGSESSGLPSCFFERWPENFVSIPMIFPGRSLNLSNSVAIGVYEALRQNDFFNRSANALP